MHTTSKLDRQVLLQHITLPEFSPTQRIDKPLSAYVFDKANSPYDLIMGLDVLVPLGIDLSCSTQQVTWMQLVIPFRPRSYFDDSLLQDPIAHLSHCLAIDQFDTVDLFSSAVVTPLLSSKYEQADTTDIAAQQKHLSKGQQLQLATLLAKYQKLFSGNLDCFPDYQVHLELNSNARPFHCQPYPVPAVHRQVFKEELDRLEQIGVLRRCGPSEYLSPTFLVAKKDGRVRWVSDFRTLNTMIKRKVYPLPKIHDILRRRKGYVFFTKIDISMQFYTFLLDKHSRKLCTICTPLDNY